MDAELSPSLDPQEPPAPRDASAAAASRNLLGMTPKDLVAALAGDGIEASEAECRRILARVISDGADHARPVRPVKREIQHAIDTQYSLARLKVVERAEDPVDGFMKYLFEAHDGALVEAVRIPLHREGRFTVCLSSQVGCAMECAFCATGRMGLSRNLRPEEIVSQFLTVRDEAPGRVTGAVFMGQGEPFHNYNHVIQTAKVLADPCGGRISAENITISTVGLVRRIRQYTAEGHPFRLIVSLSSAIEAKRKTLLPIAGQTPLTEVAAAIREHAEKSRTRATIAWVVMGGVNTGADEVDALKEILGDVPLRVNLIDVNDAREDGFQRASDVERAAFMDALSTLEVPMVRRYSGGQGKHAACGMLAAKRFSEGESDRS